MNPDLSAFLRSWTWSPTIVVGLALPAGLYARGLWRLRRRGGATSVVAPWRAGCFAGGLATIALALLSPIDAYDDSLFFVHMIQHLLLLMLAAPLLLLERPLVPLLWGLPAGLRKRVGRVFVRGHPLQRVGHALTQPVVALTLYVGTIAFWHLPLFYDAAEGQTTTHNVEHLSFFLVALAYWWPIVQPSGGRRRLGYLLALPYLIPPLVEGFAIGVLLTFAGHPLYPYYQTVPRLWGLSVLADQQLGGLIMWVPGGMMYLIPVLILLALHMQQEERAQERREGLGEVDVGALSPQGRGQAG